MDTTRLLSVLWLWGGLAAITPAAAIIRLMVQRRPHAVSESSECLVFWPDGRGWAMLFLMVLGLPLLVPIVLVAGLARYLSTGDGLGVFLEDYLYDLSVLEKSKYAGCRHDYRTIKSDCNSWRFKTLEECTICGKRREGGFELPI